MTVTYYARASIAFQQDVNDPVSRARVLATLGRLFEDVGENPRAHTALTEAYELLAERPRHRDEAQVVGRWLRRLDKPDAIES